MFENVRMSLEVVYVHLDEVERKLEEMGFVQAPVEKFDWEAFGQEPLSCLQHKSRHSDDFPTLHELLHALDDWNVSDEDFFCPPGLDGEPMESACAVTFNIQVEGEWYTCNYLIWYGNVFIFPRG